MRRLLKKVAKWEWMLDRNSDFNKLKQELTTLTCLAHDNGKKENIVTNDACKFGLGFALWPKQGIRELKPITFASRYLKNDKKDSISELEQLAAVWGFGVQKDSDSIYTVNRTKISWTIMLSNPLLKMNKVNKQYSARLDGWIG